MKQLSSSTSMIENITEPATQFKGYTLEELRYQKALVLVRKEFCKSKLLRNVDSLKKHNPLSPSSDGVLLPGTFGSIASKLVKGLNYLDYMMIGFSVFGSVRKVLTFFKKNRKG